MLCGTFSLDEQCANLLTKAGLPDLLITILKGKLHVVISSTLWVGMVLYMDVQCTCMCAETEV